MNKRAQSAMEYLMTYGWAILVVLIALGALFYLGVFSPSVPNTCQFNTPFICVGGDVLGTHGVEDDEIIFKVGPQSGITGPGITKILLDGTDITDNCGDVSLSAGIEKTIKCGAAAGIFFSDDGEKFSGVVSFTYTGAAGPHTVQGTFSGTAE